MKVESTVPILYPMGVYTFAAVWPERVLRR